ncbi:MAG: alpha/beta hydrolase [Rhizomicrobium sp.]
MTMRTVRSALLGLGVMLVVGVAAQAASPDASVPTKLIESDGHKIAFHVTPGHLPIIVLDAGGGNDSSYWNTLVPVLSAKTGCEIITYDRAGFGESDEVSGPWNVQSATTDLENGLQALGATKNVILVAHSLAGEIATYLARQHPDWVSGAVMVDANVPEFFTDKENARAQAMYKPLIAAAKAAPPSKSDRQLLQVAESFEQTARAFHKVTWPRSVPVMVIVSGKTPFPSSKVDADAWRAAHRQFVAAAINRHYITATGSSHDVAHDRPDVIIKAITDMISRVH